MCIHLSIGQYILLFKISTNGLFKLTIKKIYEKLCTEYNIKRIK